jgi:hypothetical protein
VASHGAFWRRGVKTHRCPRGIEKRRREVPEKEAKNRYVRVKDMAGNSFLCPIDALKDPGDVSEEELELCVDNAIAERYAGEIKVEDQ